MVAENLKSGVSWVHSHVSQALGKSFCVYDGRSPEAIRETAARNDLPVGEITKVSVLDPYFHRS